MSLFQHVDANKNLFRPNNLSVLVNSCTTKTGAKFFALSGASWKGLVFSLEHLGAFILVIK